MPHIAQALGSATVRGCWGRRAGSPVRGCGDWKGGCLCPRSECEAPRYLFHPQSSVQSEPECASVSLWLSVPPTPLCLCPRVSVPVHVYVHFSLLLLASGCV